MDLRVILQKTLTQISGITYMKEKKYIPSCSIIIYRLMLTEISGSHASVEILLLKCDGKIQKPLEYHFHHNITHLLKVSVQGFIKEEEILIILCMSYHAKFFYWRLFFHSLSFTMN